MRLLLISNSTMPGEPYLDYPKQAIKAFLGDKPVNALFIPYAAVTFSFDDYVEKVQERFSEIGHQVTGIHTFSDPVEAVRRAEAIVVGGGNTWQLVRMMHDNHLVIAIREKVYGGTPFIGWSAGANVACPTLRTTNDMPVIDPHSFDTIGLVPFQINPHYLDANPDGHAGETREQRILEFLEINPGVTVLGLREGTMLLREGNQLSLKGSRKARIFRKGEKPLELSETDDFSFLLHQDLRFPTA
ncbi:MAG: dipeptidase PepE [Prolixibacteraceae bacterium]|jgi:dipeptidase E|nr:dipeptidase PepE [Prolixibacteraceae bacterium]MDI9562916.1 dipeptidase PepE [Bacteroidota bacterium]NLS99851.1 dipeptidase PepE [Bacteroidales bacterium]OQB80195.1 MAG: Peptidase E [Bacteroidetes bacterium ADurb.Bin123]HNZ67915.1 dipeptidase PepE [Prolixibacteraceae bacterium]